jgi:hypothetical protein
MIARGKNQATWNGPTDEEIDADRPVLEQQWKKQLRAEKRRLASQHKR